MVGSELESVQGWASLTVLVTFLAGVQLIVLGTIGLYVARAYEQGKHRPLYLIASADGLKAGPSGPLREAPRTAHPRGSQPRRRSIHRSRRTPAVKKTM